MTKYFQQGDVLMFPVKLPKGAKRLQTNVLQEGEHTGHAHRLQFRHDDQSIGSGVFQHPKSLEKYFKLEKPTALRHEEHKEIMMPAGEYRVGIVREYDHFAEEARNVVD
jgi:hypothetical protein